MALIKSLFGKTPQFGTDCFLAENATIIGDVVAGHQCSFWYQSVVRGDVHQIRLGHRVNVQDGAILHCTYQKFDLQIGDDVSIGHRAIVHGCHIGSKVLIGMGAIVLDGAHIKDEVLIAAGAVIKEGMVCESGYLYAGVPAKKIKLLSEEMRRGQIERIAKAYPKYADWYQQE
ncbi:MAG: gamma carbonic anhydrase family protein [Bacteroidota bacterium]